MPHELEPIEILDRAESGATVARVSAEVFETMFFTEAVTAECEHTWIANGLSIRVSFDGSHCGDMRLAIAEDAVPAISSAFLGIEAEQTHETEQLQVMLELANILCGAVLSAIWPESELLLKMPQICPWPADDRGSWHRCLALPEGRLALSLQLAGGQETP